MGGYVPIIGYKMLAMEGFDQPTFDLVVETTLEIQMPNKSQNIYVVHF
jgi:hypothetical protein